MSSRGNVYLTRLDVKVWAKYMKTVFMRYILFGISRLRVNGLCFRCYAFFGHFIVLIDFVFNRTTLRGQCN